MGKTIEDYKERVEYWKKTVDPYVKDPHREASHVLNFINSTYADMFISRINKEICVFQVRNNLYSFYAGTGSRFCWTPNSRKYIESWFAKHYPRVNPWTDEVVIKKTRR